MRVDVHREEIIRLILPTGQVGLAAARGAGKIRDRAKELATVDSGLMRNSITAELHEQSPTSVVWRIGSDVFYARYQELGTPPIFVRRAPLLVFKVGNQWVSTLSTRGVPAVHFLSRAIDSATIDDFN